MTRRNLQKAFGRLDAIKKTRDPEVPGILGFTVNGINTVEVGNRSGFVWVRLRNNANEVIQAFNDQVSPVYGLPVVVVRDENDRVRYKIKGKDLGVYQNWGGGSYLPRHGNQHSFNPEGGGGGDVTFIYNRQFMPLAVHPSGTSGGGNVYIQPYAYYQNTQWKYAGGTGTANILPYKPTGTSARMVLVYLDGNGNPQLLPSGNFFDSSITGNAAVLAYVPSLLANTDIPLGAVRLVSGTSTLVWDNIYDLRPIIVSDGFIPTGTTAHTIQDDGTPLTQRTVLNFVGSALVAYDAGGVTNVSGTFVGGGGGGLSSIPIYEDGVFKVSGTAINFIDNMNVAVSGTTAYVSSVGGTSSPIGARVTRTTDFIFTGSGAGVGRAIPFTAEDWDTNSIHSGSSTQLYCNTAGYYHMVGNVEFDPIAASARRMVFIKRTSSSGTTSNLAKVETPAYQTMVVSCIAYMNPNDYIELMVDRGTIAADTIIHSDDYSPIFSMFKLG